MIDKFQRFTESVRPQAVAAQPETPKDDPAQADGYRAIRRVRTFDFPDVWFTDHTGTA